MTTNEVVTMLRAKCGDNAAAWARANKVSPAYISDVLRGRREPGASILKALKLRRILSYETVRAGK